jgi:hypothetical protein
MIQCQTKYVSDMKYSVVWRGREHYTPNNGELVEVADLGNRNDFELYSKAGLKKNTLYGYHTL